MQIQLLIYGACLTLLLTGYGLLTIREPSRLHRRAQEMLLKWAQEGKAWAWARDAAVPASRRLAAPWKQFMQRQKEERMEKEIAQGISYLRNAAAMGRGERMSTELLLSELASAGRLLSDVYYGMANYLRLGDSEAALHLLTQTLQSPVAADYGRLLLQWERLSPSLLMETLISHQKAIEQTRQTRQKKRDEMISDLIYFPVIMNVMLILINFIYVAYFIDQRDALLTVMG